MTLDPKLLNQLLAACERPNDILGADALFAQIKHALAERALAIPPDQLIEQRLHVV